MKLYEEFKEYENMWDDESEAPLTEDVDPVDKILHDTPDIELEYNDFVQDYDKDRYSHRDGHYTVTSSYYFPDFTYKVDAVTVFEDLRDEIIPKYATKVEQDDLLTKYLELERAWENSTPETEAATCEAMELLLAENLEDFANTFYQQLCSLHADDARAWQEEHGSYDYD